MKKMIDLDKLNDLLEEYKDFKHNDEDFESFIIGTTDNNKPVWKWVNSVGIVMKEDFEGDYSKEFIDMNFMDLAHYWFKGLNSQVDFGIVLENVRDEVKEC